VGPKSAFSPKFGRGLTFCKIMSDHKTPRTVDLQLAMANEHIRRLEAQIIQLRYRQDIHDNLIKRMHQEGKPEQGVVDIVNKHFWDLV